MLANDANNNFQMILITRTSRREVLLGALVHSNGLLVRYGLRRGRAVRWGRVIAAAAAAAAHVARSTSVGIL